jgi:hypothetical protein
MRVYTARAWREGRWWVVQIKDGNDVTLGYTQARWRWQVRGMVIDWVLTRYDLIRREEIRVKVVLGVEPAL